MIGSLSWEWFLLCLAASFMVLLASWKLGFILLAWWLAPPNSPQRLLRQLAKQHGLSAREFRALQKLAATLPTEVPMGALFVDPNLWCNQEEFQRSEIAQKHLQASGTQGPASSPLLEAVFRKLFGLAQQTSSIPGIHRLSQNGFR